MTLPAYPPLIKAELRFDNNVPQIVWSRGYEGYAPYAVDLGMLRYYSDRARERLRAFVNQCMGEGAGRSGAEMKQLAAAGRNLYDALFNKTGGEGDPDEIRQWLADDLKGEHLLLFSVDPRVYIPWGLVFDSDPRGLSDDPAATDIADYGHLWCLKYKLATVYNPVPPPPRGLNNPKDLDLFKLISVLNRGVYSQAEALLGEAEKQVLYWLNESVKLFKEPIASSDALRDAWEQAGEEVDMLFFYCHANEKSLALSKEDSLSMYDMNLYLKRKKSLQNPYVCMVFLNGCSTAVGSDQGGFLETTGRPGFGGFVGTETEVPDVFALRFGIAFLYYFLNRGWPVYQVMDQLRREHWPLSLIYSTYCHPVLRVKPGEPLDLSFENFSTTRLSTSDTAVI